MSVVDSYHFRLLHHLRHIPTTPKLQHPSLHPLVIKGNYPKGIEWKIRVFSTSWAHKNYIFGFSQVIKSHNFVRIFHKYGYERI
jgi:hypothetical protein